MSDTDNTDKNTELVEDVKIEIDKENQRMTIIVGGDTELYVEPNYEGETTWRTERATATIEPPAQRDWNGTLNAIGNVVAYGHLEDLLGIDEGKNRVDAYEELSFSEIKFYEEHY